MEQAFVKEMSFLRQDVTNGQWPDNAPIMVFYSEIIEILVYIFAQPKITECYHYLIMWQNYHPMIIHY